MSVLLTTLALMLPMPADGVHVGEQPPNQASKVGHVKPKRRDQRLSVVRPYRVKLTRIAACESGGRWFINTGNGFYGGLQFTIGTWRSVGGRGMPHQNTKLEQMYRGVKVFLRRGSWADWPVCGYR